MQRLLEMLKNSEYCVVFTGAGVSTLSGIKDFRSADGLYNDSSIDADKLFLLDYFMKDPSYYYEKAREFIYGVDEKTPGLVHREIARLEAAGLVKRVITQNIDLLHQRAGSRNVIELHGSPQTHTCVSCGRSKSFDEVSPVAKEGKVPLCELCGSPLKPDIIFFGEALDMASLEAAAAEAQRADCMIVLGSSLVVQPAASIPVYTLRSGGNLIIVNNADTPLDSQAELKYDDLEETFNYIKENI